MSTHKYVPTFDADKPIEEAYIHGERVSEQIRYEDFYCKLITAWELREAQRNARRRR